MKIQSSNVTMSSNRTYNAIYEKQSAELITRDDQAAVLEFSDASKSLMEQMAENRAMISDQSAEQKKKNLEDAMANLLHLKETKETEEPAQRTKTEWELKLEILKKMLDALKRMRGGKGGISDVASEIQQLQREYKNTGTASAGVGDGVVLRNGARATGWTKTVVNSEFFAETENTSYSAQGIVKTADGREINFGVNVEMSRAFCAKYETLVQEDYIFTDPLVINLDTQVASVSDQKFLFDLDSDGKEEEISFAGKGSGFLALDKNDDGRINDGNELFGTKSGNGFKDLAAYDKDKNGWIDENDEIFKKLKIWTKDENGKDRLISLKEAGVGAIYLDYASTQFSLNRTEDNRTNGMIRNTGVYLKENGQAGMMQHIDLTL